MRTPAAMLLAVVASSGPLLAQAVQQTPQKPAEPRPVFRSGVARVSVAATVRDSRGRPVPNLTAKDFELYDNGQRREIVEFTHEQAPAGLGLLVDVSGSMQVAAKRDAAIGTAKLIVQTLGKDDRVGLFAFDRDLEEVAPLGSRPDDVLQKLGRINAWGQTSVFDAIAETSQRLSKNSGSRRAVIVLTDGDDNASRLSPEYVQKVASSIDVPVYVFVIVSPLDRAGDSNQTVIEEQLIKLQQGTLGNLARWTGGEIFVPVTPEENTAMTRQVVSELRHQYLMAFEPGGQAGWHPLDVRTRRPNLTVRARSGYMVPGQPGVGH